MRTTRRGVRLLLRMNGIDGACTVERHLRSAFFESRGMSPNAESQNVVPTGTAVSNSPRIFRGRMEAMGSDFGLDAVGS